MIYTAILPVFMEEDMEHTAESVITWSIFAIILALAACMIQGCSFKVETLYHGQTPVGISDTKATNLRAGPAQERVIKDRDQD